MSSTERARSKQDRGVKRRHRGPRKRYDVEFKLQVVRKYLEETIPATLTSQESGIDSKRVGRWARAIRQEGEAGSEMIASVTFIAIIMTILIKATTTKMHAKKLGLLIE